MRENVESALRKASFGVVILAFAGGAFFLFTLWRWGHFVTSTVKYVVENLASHSGISSNLLYGIVIIATIPFFWAVAKYMHGLWFWLRGLGPGLRLYKSVHGMIIVAYVGVYFLAMFFVARDSLAYKFCAATPEGIKVFDDRVKDPVYGIQTEPCTLDQTVEIRRIKNPILGPQRVQIGDARTFAFFEPVTGHPRIWYHKTTTGEFEFFDRNGSDPETGVPLQIVDQQTREEVIRLQDQQKVAEQQARQEQVTEAQRRGLDAVAAKYVNTGITKRAGNKQAAVFVFSNGPGQFADIEDSLGQALLNRGLTPVRSFFKPQFVQDGRAERLLAGDWSAAAQLGIGNRVDVVLIGRASVGTTDSGQFEGLVTTNLSLEFRCLDLDHESVCGTRSFSAVGAGYSKSASLQNASEKTLPEIDGFVKALRIE